MYKSLLFLLCSLSVGCTSVKKSYNLESLSFQSDSKDGQHCGWVEVNKTITTTNKSITTTVSENSLPFSDRLYYCCFENGNVKNPVCYQAKWLNRKKP